MGAKMSKASSGEKDATYGGSASLVWYRHSGQPEHNHYPPGSEQYKLVRRLEDITRDIGDHHISHLAIDGSCHLPLHKIAPQVTHLWIYNLVDASQIVSVKNLTQLKKLELSASTFPDVFETLTSLEELTIENCCIEEVPESITRLEKLEKLNIRNNLLFKLPEVATNLSSLGELDLSNCRLTQLPDNFAKLSCLRRLNLSGNPLQFLPEAVTEIRSLQVLTLVNCKLSHLPDSFSHLNCLKRLDVSRNPLECFPEVVAELSCLEELILSDCKLSELPSRFSQLQNLMLLDISRNKIEELPTSMYCLEALTDLDLSYNFELQKIDQKILNLKQLEEINVRGCSHLMLPPYAVCQQGLSAVKKFFVDLAMSMSIELMPVPVAVIGNALSGKTSLCRSLVVGKRVLTFRSSSSELDETTKVFNIEDLALQTARVKLMDYGGNEVYHLAYHMLAKERCIPMIVVNLDEFVKLISSFGLREACRQVCFKWISHLYLACPRLGAPILVLTHVDKLSADQVATTRGDLMMVSETIRSELLKEEELLTSSTLKLIPHLSNKDHPLFSCQDIFEFGNDLSDTSNIECLKLTLNNRCKEHIVSLPRIWNSVELYIQQCTEQPYLNVSQVISAFATDEVTIVLRYMHNVGSILWFENIENLSQYIFHRINKIVALISLLYHHASQQQWDDRLSNFVAFRHNDQVIGKYKYASLIDDFKHFGIMDEALLSNVLTVESAFPHSLALDLLRSFLLLHGPIKQQSRSAFLCPALSSSFMDDSYKTDGKLQLRVDIILSGLFPPNYIYQQITVAVLNQVVSLGNVVFAKRNGATVHHGKSSTYVIHSFNNQRITLQVSTDTQLLGHSWKQLVELVQTVLTFLNTAWKACRTELCVYCSHCLFLKDPSPEMTINPEWLCLSYASNSAEPSLQTSSFSGIHPVFCKGQSSSASQVPLPLKFPCYELTSSEIDELNIYLSALEPYDFADKPAESTTEVFNNSHTPVLFEESDLSDVEEEGYCDDSASDPIMKLRLRTVRMRCIKDLYRHTDKVYPMTDGIRGRILIINIHNLSQSSRQGSDVDYINISRLFKSLGFTVAKSQAELTDLSAQKIFREIEEETRREEHSHLGMFILVIMSHGIEGNVLLDHLGSPVSLVSIIDRLSPFRFPAMAGKPKLVIVQACAGARSDYGDQRELMPIEASPLHLRPVSQPDEMLRSPLLTAVPPPAADVPQAAASPPTTLNMDDFMIMKSSSESYIAIRSVTHGSWFIRVLVATFYKHSCHRDVESLFKIIQSRVRQISLSKANYSFGGNVPSSICTFTNYRKLYFFPGFPRH